MIDPKIEEQISATQQLLQFWQRFHDYFAFGVKGTDIDQQREREFLQIKSQVAMLHDSFMDALTHDRNIGQNIMGICSRSITLKNLKKLSNADVQKMEIEWHESYLLLNETLGALQEKRQQMADINPFVFKTKRSLNNAKIQMLNFFKQGWVKAALVIILIIGGITALFAFNVIDVKVFKNQKYLKPIYDIMKKVNTAIPYDNFNEIQRKKDWPGSEVKWDTAGVWNTSSIKSQYFPKFNIFDNEGEVFPILDKGLEVSYALETQPNNEQIPPAEIVMVRFLEPKEATEFAYRLKKQYDAIIGAANQPSYLQVFAVRNIAVMVSSTDTSLPRDIKSREFGM